MEKVQPQVSRVQDQLIEFFRTQTNLSIRLSENLQNLSRDLLDRTRKVMADKLPLLGAFSLNNTSTQTIFQVASAIAVGGLQLASIQAGASSSRIAAEMGSAPASTADLGVISRYTRLSNEKSEFDTRQGFTEAGSKLTNTTSQAFMTFLQGKGSTYEFNSSDLTKTRDETTACLRNTQEAQALLASTIKQVLGH